MAEKTLIQLLSTAAGNYYTSFTSTRQQTMTEKAYTCLAAEGLAINNIKTGNLSANYLFLAASSAPCQSET